MLYDKDKISILYQGMDTLVIGVKCTDEIYYNSTHSSFLNRLYDLKNEAKNINSYGEKFVKDDLGLNLGDFLISSKGINAYAYTFKNDDIFVSVSNTKFNVSNVYHLKVQFRSKFLLVYGHKKAYEFVDFMLRKIFSEHYEVTILRFDLCADITGIKYTPKDYFNFRTFRKISNFIDTVNFDEKIDNDEKNLTYQNFDTLDTKSFIRFNRFEGVSFGKNPAMFRIYDKAKEISNKNLAPYIFKKWEINGFSFDTKDYVFRHECEFGRAYIKKLIPKCDDEVEFLFDNISSFWLKGLELCKWYDLNDDEISRIQSNDLQSNSISKIYQRIDKNPNRLQFWDYLKVWKNENIDLDLYKNNIEFVPNMEKCKRALKGFISQVYTNLGYQGAFRDVLLAVEKDLAKDGLNLHTYGLQKVADKFFDNEELHIKKEISNNKMADIFENSLIDFIFSLDEVSNEDYKKSLNKALSLYYDKT